MDKHVVFLILFFISAFLEAYEGVKTIAFAQDNMANDFRKAQVYETRDEIKKYSNLHFVYSDAKGKTATLIYQIDKFIKEKVDLLIVGTNDADAVVPVISKAYENGIPVIILDRGINTQNYTTFINSDNIEIGTLAAKHIGKKLSYKGSVLLFEGLQNADVTQLRTKGFMDEISQYKDIQVIKRTGNYLRKDAISEMEKLVKEGIRTDAIFSQSDSMLSGVRLVLQKYGIKESSIVMVGCDYTGEAKIAIDNATQDSSIKFPLGGKEAVQTAVKILSKESVPKHISIPVALVTKENLHKVEPIF
ncbi:MAG: substrate-binding domain-containing protein [Sulfurimonas sp.]|nr:substrate-binding domain-containing protein [Sulfurimonas sp.]MBU3938081.1 substrate-binding domain-containing protein [bacterium]MBU4023768.1 substrate-binding domain-containing protein [bacterium]MBU4058426.1 substrate-binding domain-containing protein [bacterium]MBU4110897.1 substrate-binding domain-containing protein [bacterium]